MDWREKLFGRVLIKCDSSGTQNGKFETVQTLEALSDCVEDGEGAVCGIYFSFANISDKSDDFGVRLEEMYKKVLPRLKVVEVVLWAHVGTPEGPVEREAGFIRNLTGKSWFAVPFHDVDIKVRFIFIFNYNYIVYILYFGILYFERVLIYISNHEKQTFNYRTINYL